MADRYDPKEISSLADSVRKIFSLDEPQEMSTAETAADIAAGFVPGVGTAQAARDFERARRSDDKLGMAFAGVGAIPILGGVVKPAKAAAKSLASMAERYAVKETPKEVVKEAPKEQKMLQGFYRGYAGENTPAKTAFGSDTYFVSPQRKVGDYYAKRRAAETGEDPHLEMILADPFLSRNNPYGLSIPIDKYNRDFLMTRARRVDPDEVKERTKLYAKGGLVDFDPDEIDRLAQSTLQGYAEGGRVYSPRPGLVFVGQEHGETPELPQDIRDLASEVGAFYEGAGGDKMPEIQYKGSWDDLASKSVEGYPSEYLYTIFTNTDVNKQKDALVGDDTIFDSLLKNQDRVGYFKDRRFGRKELENFLSSMGLEFLNNSKSLATESNVENFLKSGEKLMWESGKTPARDMADKANESRQRWLLNQPKGVFFMGSDHLEKLKELHGKGKGASIQKKAAGGLVDYDPEEIDTIASKLKEAFHG